MKGEIGKGEFKGLIIDRSKMQEEIDSQIEVSAKEFQKLESSEGDKEGGSQFYEGEGDVLQGGGTGRSSFWNDGRR